MLDARIRVRLTPRAGRDELDGFHDGVLRVRVAAPPVDGKANRALCRLIAKRLRVAPSRVTVLQGKRSREKLVGVEEIDTDRAVSALKSR